MGSPVDISTILQLIQYCRDKVETVRSNKEACAILTDDLELIHEILLTLDPIEAMKAEKHKFHIVMNRLYRITARTNILFDRCRSGKIMIKIKNVLFSTRIKDELKKLHSEIPLVIAMLSLVFHIKQSSAYSRGGSTIPKIDDSVFDEDDEINMGVSEDYYEDDDE